MFANRKRRKVLHGRVNLHFDEFRSLMAKVDVARKANDEKGRAEAYEAAMWKIGVRRVAEQSLEQFESEIILRKACHLAIEVPSPKEKPTWWDNNYEQGMPPEAVTDWLSVTGRIAVSKMIKLERRANFEWWFTKIVLPALQALVPIIALILGIISVAKQ